MLGMGQAETNLEWARVVVPLKIGQELSGIWLLGARDPDDLYDSEDLELLESLAAQTALALAHIDQTNSLRSLYLEDVNRREGERLDFARELHDAVLNPLAVIRNSPYMAQAPVQVDTLMEETIQHVRQVVKGLRPEMLNYGLNSGLHALADDLSDAVPQGSPEISIDVIDNGVRLEHGVELNLFRVVQQACQNSLRHAGAKRLSISGLVEDEQVELTVSDDGSGFDFQGQLDLADLLAHQHYGLAGMYERASVIGGQMRIQSGRGQGTTVQVSWKKSR